MALYSIGKIIKEVRKRRHFSQTQLGGGMYDAAAISRIEAGKRVPNFSILRKILQGLGLNVMALNFFISEAEFKREQVAIEIRTSVAERNYDITDLLYKYEHCTKENMSSVERQFFLLFTGIKKVELEKASPETVLPLYEKALKLTLSDFSLSGVVTSTMFSLEELLLLNNIALEEWKIPSMQERALNRLYFLKDYFEHNAIDPIEKVRQYPIILANLANFEEDRQKFQKELDLAEQGISFCCKYGNTNGLCSLILNKGIALGYLGQHKEAKKCLKMALAMKVARGVDVSLYQKNIQNALGYDFSDFLSQII